MKIKFININQGEQFVHKNKKVNVGDEIDVPKARGDELISRGKVEAVKESPKKKTESNGSDK